MKIIKTISILVTLAMLSCSKENPEYYAYNFFENAELLIESYDESYVKQAVIEEGTNLVFEYEYSAEDEVDIADDEYSEFIRFEINPALMEFNYENEELTEIKAVLSKRCYCGFGYDENKDVLPTGTISGKKISQTVWNISIDVTFYGDENKKVSGRFILKN